MKRILSIDGGGMAGIVPCLVLAEFERVAGAPAARRFDMIAGTSTGAIIALMLAHPKRYSALDVLKLYVDEGPVIFRRRWLDRAADVLGLWENKYPASGIEGVLKKYMGETPMGEAAVEVAIPALNVATGKPEIFGRSSAVAMWQAARASSAAPTYFPAYGPYVDGGLFANDPAAVAVSRARALWPAHEMFVLSLGCGYGAATAPAKGAARAGLVWWLPRIVGILMSGSIGVVEEEMGQALKTGYVRIPDAPLGRDWAMDDARPETSEARIAEGLRAVSRSAAAIARAAAMTKPYAAIQERA